MDGGAQARRRARPGGRYPGPAPAGVTLGPDTRRAPLYRVGDVVEGRYRLQRLLGRGSAATVFAAVDQELDRPVALKLLTGRNVVADPERLQAEAQALARLEHPNIVQVFQVGVSQGQPYLVLELAEGGSLLDRLAEGALEPEEVVQVAGPVLEALRCAHDAGVLHRDVKPENVLMTKDGVPKLGDFGLAKAEGSGVHTATGVLLGTPEFMAPELFEGHKATPAADLYAWGTLAYLLLNDRLPWEGDLATMARAKTLGTLTPGREVGGLRAAIRCALERDPRDRGDAARLLGLLSGKVVAREGPTVLRSAVGAPGGPGRTVAERAPGHGRWWVPAALGATALVAAVALVVGSGRTPASPPVSVVSGGDDGAATSRAGPEALAALGRWRGRTVDPAPEIAGLHRRVMPPSNLGDVLLSDFFQRHMVAERKGLKTRADLDVLLAARQTLPYREDLGLDGPALRRAFQDSSIPWRERAEAFSAVQGLAMIDAYYQAWGMVAPYGARPILDRLVRMRAVDAPSEIGPPPLEVPPQGVTGPGRWTVFRWRDPGDVGWPILFPDEGTPTNNEEVAFRLYADESDGRWIKERHMGMTAAFSVPDTAALKDRKVRLVMQMAGLFTATVLRIEWNGLELIYPAEPSRSLHEYWNNGPVPDYLLEVHLPPESFVIGENTLRFRTSSLPGLERCCGFGFDRVELVVE